MRALVVSPEPFFTPRGTPFSVYYRTLVTAELGVEVDLLTYGQGQDVDLPGVRIVRIPRFGFLGEIPVGPSLVKAFLDVFLVLWTLALLLRHRYDVVHAHEEAVFYCRFLKPVFRFQLVYDMHSCLPQQLENFRFTRSRLLVGAFRWLEDQALRAADAVITICPDLAEYALRAGVDPDRHFLIENSLFEPVRLAGTPASDTAAAARDVPLPPEDGVKRVVYAGTLEPYQGIDLLLDALALLHARLPDVRAVILGGNAEQVAGYRARAAALFLSDVVTFTGRVSQTAARAWCGAAAVQVSPRIAGTNTPLKVYEQLASGVPLVATAIHAHTQVLDDAVAFLAKPEPGPMADALERALRDDAERARRVAAARELYATRYARDRYEQKMRALLAAVA